MRATVCITIDKDLREKAKKFCDDNSRKFSNVVEEALKQYLPKERK